VAQASKATEMETWCGAKDENQVTTGRIKFFNESRGSDFIVRDEPSDDHINPSM